MNQDEKLWCGLSYVGLLICALPTLVILLLKKNESPAIKFHALQALALFLVMVVINVVLNIVNMIAMSALGPLAIVTGLGAALISLALLGYWIFLTVKVFMGDDIDIPVVGGFIRTNLL